MSALFDVPSPVNEPVRDYRPDSAEWASLRAELERMRLSPIELPAYVGGWRMGGGPEMAVVEPHLRSSRLGVTRFVTEAQAAQGIDTALEAAEDWRRLSYEDRAAVFLRAAELLSGPWRDVINAATMLGQSKTSYQAEIDAACELADFWRFNVAFGRQILQQQPMANAPATWNRTEHRALEGFVYAITPFNFTSIAANLASAPALMGNVVVWKPSPTQQLAAHHTMRLLEAAGLPPGVITMLPGAGPEVSAAALAHPMLAGIHFTGSTRTFQGLYAEVGSRIAGYRSYPRVVGETGGKDFVVAHPSAEVDGLRTALLRGAFDYQGQKCSAASRAYVPRSVWARLRDDLVDRTDALRMGDVTEPESFLGAVIDERAYARHVEAIARARAASSCEILAGGTHDDSTGFFVRPTIVETHDLGDEGLRTEYFGPILTVHVFDDGDFDAILDHIDRDSVYALTGAVFADDRRAIAHATARLADVAGNFYINDKPTGAVVGQQPFGGARASGTNDKAGATDNLKRWTSPRSIKENLLPPRQHGYPHQGLG